MRELFLQLDLNYEAVAQISASLGAFLVLAAVLTMIVRDQYTLPHHYQGDGTHFYEAVGVLIGILLIIVALILWVLDLVGEIFNWILREFA